MNKKDKQIVKDSIDAIVSTIPGLNLAWGLSEALYGAGLKLRQQKALEWVEMVRDNRGYFTKEVVADPAFQDGFVIALEKYLVERNEEKRKIYRNIFLGFTKADDKAVFSLEKFIHTLSQLSEKDIETLGDVDINNEGMKPNNKNYQIYGNEDKEIESIYSLINLGLLLNVTGNRLGPIHAPFVQVSIFGREFIKYLEEPN